MSRSSSQKMTAPSCLSSLIVSFEPETRRFSVPSPSTRSKFLAWITWIAGPLRHVTSAPASVSVTSPLTSPVLTTMQPSSSLPETE